MGPLGDVTVLDVSQSGVGPWTGTLLGTLGARVIRVDPPIGTAAASSRPLSKEPYYLPGRQRIQT